MARKRMIDPSIWADEGMAELTPRQQLLYVGLFSNADDDGRLKGSPRAVALMLPTVYGGVDPAEVEADLSAVVAAMTQLIRYEVDGRPYLAFRNYRRWQRIDRPSPSDLPAPPAEPSPNDRPPTGDAPEQSATGRERFDEESSNDRRGVPPSRKEEKRNELRLVEPPPEEPSEPAPDPSARPYDLLEALFDELGLDAGVLERPEREKQLAAAKRLLKASVGPAEVRGVVRWLAGQRWVQEGGGGIDLFLVEKQAAKWKLAGRPTGPPLAALSPNSARRGQVVL